MALPTDFGAFLETFNSEKFRELLPIQQEALRQYASAFFGKRDVAFEMPTGKGKSLIALLIAEAWRREGKKVAILTANKTLARQMRDREAAVLGVQTALMEGRGEEIPPALKRAYNRGQAIGIMNYWVYFNQNPAVDPADVLVMDDAHLAEPCLSSLYSVEITRHDHGLLFESLMTELANHFPEYIVVQDAVTNSRTANNPPELLSFLDQVGVAARLQEIIDASPLLTPPADLTFRWRRLRDKMVEANIYLSRDSIWIRPGVYPLESNSHYSQVTQCLYMSATIGEQDDLSRQLGTRPIDKIPLSHEHTTTTSGRRLIVMNRADDEPIPDRLEAALIAGLRRSPKSLWLCASTAEATMYRTAVAEWLNENGFVGHPNWLLTNLGNELEEFRVSPTGHLFVGGRFDGMSFERDECRIVVVTTLPRAINTQEEFFCGYLRDAAFMKRRLNGRIIQALGRCNRAPDDYAVYFLCDKRFDTHLGREENRVGLTSNVAAEFDMAQDLSVETTETLTARVDRFLDGDFREYDEHLATLQAFVPPDQVSSGLPVPVDREVLGWNALFESKNYTVAHGAFERCWEAAKTANLRELGGYYGWCAAKAAFLAARLERANPAPAVEILRQAIDRGGRSSWFNRLRGSLGRFQQQARNPEFSNDEYFNAIIRGFDARLEREGTRTQKFERWCARVDDQLNSSSHDIFATALLELASLLGFDGSRPRYSSATDVLWRGIFNQAREVFTFELKMEHLASTRISASDVGQAHNQLTRAEAEFVRLGYGVRAFIVTHLVEIEPDAASSLGRIRILAKDRILEMWQRVRALLSRYRSTWNPDDLAARQRAASELQPLLPPEGWLTRAGNTDESMISSDAFFREWPFASSELCNL